MGEKTLESGVTIFTEGDTADAAYILVSGGVELSEMSQGREISTGKIEAGKVFGELAVFDPQSLRPYTARTTEATVLKALTTEEFQSALPACPQAILPLLTLAIERMRGTRSKIKTATVAVSVSDITKITLTPTSEKLKAQIKPIEIAMNRLPFRIGGYPEGGEASRRDQLHLSIASQINPLRVSRQHCEIVVEDNVLLLCDLASRFCTQVNGAIIGRGHGIYSAPLQKGVNEVVLGPAESNQYTFTLKCE